MDSTTQGSRVRTPRRRKRAYVIRRIKREPAPGMEQGPGPEPGRPVATETRDASLPRPLTLTPEERYRAIAEAAYYIAERRGFQEGDPAQDWREAEAQIDAWLLEAGLTDRSNSW